MWSFFSARSSNHFSTDIGTNNRRSKGHLEALDCDANHRVNSRMVRVPARDALRLEWKTQDSNSWYAPALDCELLHREGYILSFDGTRLVLSTLAAKEIRPGTVDEALFRVPSYPERSPSMVYSELRRREPNAPVPRDDVAVQQDSGYHTSRNVAVSQQ